MIQRSAHVHAGSVLLSVGPGLVLLTVDNVEVLRQVGLSGQPAAEGALVLRQPVRLDDVTASASASTGAAVVRPGDDVGAEKVLSAADARRYENERALRATGPSDVTRPTGDHPSGRCRCGPVRPMTRA